MLIKKPDDIPSREITPKDVYVNRRLFMRGAITVGSVAATGGLYRLLNRPPTVDAPVQHVNLPTTAPSGASAYEPTIQKAFTVDEARTSRQDITHYNNFYEFSTSKEAVAYAAKEFVAKPWTVDVRGLCAKPKTFDLDDLRKIQWEERTYRMRCVEAWSMVIPWVGFPISALLNKVEPLSSAKYVKFTTLLDPKRMPNQDRRVLDWPYIEGLRMDEAMHPLAILATGLYDELLPPQNGAPVRLGRAVEVWLQGHQVDREDRARRGAA